MSGSDSQSDMEAVRDHSSAESDSDDPDPYISDSSSADEDVPLPDIDDLLESGRVWENLTEEEVGISWYFLERLAI